MKDKFQRRLNMKDKNMPLWVVMLLATFLMTVTGCVSTGSVEPYTGKIEYKLVIEGFEWGPAITKVVLIMPDQVSPQSFDKETFIVKAGETERTVVNAYVSDEKGGRDSTGTAITVELKTGYADAATLPPIGGPIENSSPFSYDLETGRNVWAPLDIYTISTGQGKSVIIGGIPKTFTVAPENYTGKIAPSSDDMVKSSHIFNSIKLNYASYEPLQFKSDSGKNPLIIWLHGSGGGSAADPDIALYDNDVTAIIEPAIQGHFKKNGLEGAYVLYPQAPTWWMDNGKGEMTAQGPVSAFTEALKSLIDAYLSERPDIDPGCIYLGGCSNGGYMTVNMLVHYPGFFAAAFPICEAFLDQELTDAAVASLAQEAIWFTHAANDPVVPPESTVLGTYTRLVKAGANNVHFSYFENVLGQDTPGIEYLGHFSWIYVLQDRAALDQDIAAVRFEGMAAIKVPSIVPVQANGAPTTLWGWLAAQKR
jgi:predicted peptidase